jgi:hypothetical protein
LSLNSLTLSPHIDEFAQLLVHFRIRLIISRAALVAFLSVIKIGFYVNIPS